MEIGQFLGPRSVAGDQDVISLNRLDFNSSLEIGYLQRLLENMKENSSLLGRVQILIDQDNRRLFVTLPQDLLFESGSVSINERGQKAVAELAQILSKIPNQIEVVGHADPRPPSGGRSNWEFSLERAVAVANALRKNNYERPIPIKGHSSGLYEMLPKTLSEAERLSLSRRVDIIINNHDGSQQERYGIGYPE
jgi:chemotaxis protein MotB